MVYPKHAKTYETLVRSNNKCHLFCLNSEFRMPLTSLNVGNRIFIYPELQRWLFLFLIIFFSMHSLRPSRFRVIILDRKYQNLLLRQICWRNFGQISAARCHRNHFSARILSSWKLSVMIKWPRTYLRGVWNLKNILSNRVSTRTVAVQCVSLLMDMCVYQ